MRKVLHVCYKPDMIHFDRLKYLCLNSLELQHLHTGFIEIFEIVIDFSSPLLKNSLQFFVVSCTHGHRFKLFVPFTNLNICKQFLFFV